MLMTPVTVPCQCVDGNVEVFDQPRLLEHLETQTRGLAGRDTARVESKVCEIQKIMGMFTIQHPLDCFVIDLKHTSP